MSESKYRRYSDTQLTAYSQKRRYATRDLFERFIKEIDFIIDESTVEYTPVDQVTKEELETYNAEVDKLLLEIDKIIEKLNSVEGAYEEDIGEYIDEFNNIVARFTVDLVNKLTKYDNPEALVKSAYYNIKNTLKLKIENLNSLGEPVLDYNSFTSNTSLMKNDLVKIPTDTEIVREGKVYLQKDKWVCLCELYCDFFKNDSNEPIFAFELILKSDFQYLKCICSYTSVTGFSVYVDYFVSNLQNDLDDIEIVPVFNTVMSDKSLYYIFLSGVGKYKCILKPLMGDFRSYDIRTFNNIYLKPRDVELKKYDFTIDNSFQVNINNIVTLKPNTFGLMSSDLNVNKVKIEYSEQNDMKLQLISVDVDNATAKIEDISDDGSMEVESVIRKDDTDLYGPQFLYDIFKDKLDDNRIYQFIGTIRVNGKLYKVSNVRIKKSGNGDFGLIQFFLDKDQRITENVNNFEKIEIPEINPLLR